MGYVSKLGDVADLVSAIRQVARGQASIDASSLTSLVGYLGSAADEAAAPDWRLDRLSEREQEVLELIAQGRNNREIADQLCISESTVRSHLHNILDKLHVVNRVQAAAYVQMAKSKAAPRQGREGLGPPGSGGTDGPFPNARPR